MAISRCFGLLIFLILLSLGHAEDPADPNVLPKLRGMKDRFSKPFKERLEKAIEKAAADGTIDADQADVLHGEVKEHSEKRMGIRNELKALEEGGASHSEALLKLKDSKEKLRMEHRDFMRNNRNIFYGRDRKGVEKEELNAAELVKDMNIKKGWLDMKKKDIRERHKRKKKGFFSGWGSADNKPKLKSVTDNIRNFRNKGFGDFDRIVEDGGIDLWLEKSASRINNFVDKISASGNFTDDEMLAIHEEIDEWIHDEKEMAIEGKMHISQMQKDEQKFMLSLKNKLEL